MNLKENLDFSQLLDIGNSKKFIDTKKHIIGFVIVNWNGKIYLEKCLDSILNQTYKKFVIIIVDNNSKDGSIEFLESKYTNINNSKTSNIILLEQKQNLGFAQANNIGIKYLLKNYKNLKYVFLLNNDTYIPQNLLKVYIDTFKNLRKRNEHFANRPLPKEESNTKSNVGKNFKIGVLVSKMFFWDEKTIHSTGMLLNKDLSCENRKENKEISDYVFGAIGAGVFIKKEVLTKIKSNWMDKNFFAYKEDDDLAWKAQLFGYKALYIPNAVIYHKGGGTTPSFSLKKLFYLERNRIWILLKYAPFIYILKSIFFYNILRYFKDKKKLSIQNEQKTVINNCKTYNNISKPSKFLIIYTIFKAYIFALNPKVLYSILKFRLSFKPKVSFYKVVKY